MSAVTAFQQLAEALAATLTASPPLAGGHIKANPTRAWPREVQQCISVRMVRAQQASGTNCGCEWVVDYAFEIDARAIGLDDPAKAVDALLSAVAARVSAADLSAAGFTGWLPESSIEWTFDAEDTQFVQARYRISLFVNTADNLTVST